MSDDRPVTAHRVLREDDPALPGLLEAGWRIAHRSWGARLTPPADPAPLGALVAHAVAQGFEVRELGEESDAQVVALEAAVRDDYPGGPATAPPRRTRASLREDRARGTRWFGGFDGGDLVAVTAIHLDGDRAETDFTSVAAASRRRGLAEAVKAASVLALAADGVRQFGTGGAAENAASTAMNRRLGYLLTERWVTLRAP